MALFRSVVLPELARLGFVEGRNLAITTHIGLPARMPELAREVLTARPDVVMATSLVAIEAMKVASSTVPIVMSFLGEGDPVALGWAKSLGRPGGTVTGVVNPAPELDGKRLGMLHEAVPSARRVAILSSRPPRKTVNVQQMQRVASALGLEAHVFHADEPSDYAAPSPACARRGSKH